jgi:hypothetical protein
MTAPFA